MWFIDAGSVTTIETTPISTRYFSEDDRIEIADVLARRQPVKVIANPDGSYQPWFTHWAGGSYAAA